MYRRIIYLSLLTGSVLILFQLYNWTNTGMYPVPTGGIHVKADMEDAKDKNLKKSWFEAIHRAAPDVDWRTIEAKTAFTKYQNKLSLTQNSTKGGGKISVGNGALIGEWKEKGSRNQSGSMLKMAYNKHEDLLYAISAGGSIWKGGLGGLTWEVVNDQLRFDSRFLDIVYPSDHDYRVIASINGVPHYLNADSKEWVKSMGFEQFELRLENKDQLISHNGRFVFFLSKAINEDLTRLFVSEDYGASFAEIKQFANIALAHLSAAVNAQNDEFYLIERITNGRSRIYKFHYAFKELILINGATRINFGETAGVNLKTITAGGITKLYSYDEQNKLHSSKDNGDNWVFVGQLPIRPWDSGLHISPNDPNIMMIGGIEAFRSTNGGASWRRVNRWTDYYSDQSTTLHADIMSIEEMETPGGIVLAISSHGGISRSYDLGKTYLNISLNGLNASQYYSVKTYPYNQNYIMAGSQDQGLQRSYDLEEGPNNFEQFISGDYGHLQFTNHGRSMWAIYPEGWISYYPDPINGNLTADFALLTNNKSVWLPPIISSPYNPNAILVAGGSLLGTSGSHIVELVVDDLSQLTASQWIYNFAANGGEVSAMSYCPARLQDFYVLTTIGEIYKSNDNGQHFRRVGQGLSAAHHLYGNTILNSALDPNLVLIGGSGYSNPAVFISHDGAESFVPMTNGLPPTTVFNMVFDENEDFIFAATEAGPYVYIMKEGQWYDLALGAAPNLRYWSVEYLSEKQKVRFGTYGRGIWDLDLEVLSNNKEINLSPLSLYPNPASNQLSVKNLPESGQVRIINQRGQQLFSETMTALHIENIDISGFPVGLYYLIFDGKENHLSTRFIKI